MKKQYERILKISKKNGKTRKIYVPTKEASLLQKKQLSNLNSLFLKYLKKNSMGYPALLNTPQAFISGRSPVSNAKQHIGFSCTISMDLSNFFDTVTYHHLKEYFDSKIMWKRWEDGNKYQKRKYRLKSTLFQKYLVDGKLVQGFRSSPTLANLAFLKTDKSIYLALEELLGEDFVYTRYADDITVSFNDLSKISEIKNLITKFVDEHGFKINTKKTKIQKASRGYRTITGVSVGNDHIKPSRKTLQKQRAAKYQNNSSSSQGLQAWIDFIQK